jgi:hypothetical protein
MPQPRRASARIAIAVAVLTLVLGIGAFRTAAAQETDSVVVDLAEQNSSGISGTATLTAEGKKTQVRIELQGEVGDNPANIFAGDCTDYDAKPVYGLEAVNADGVSESTIDVALADLQASAYQVSVHKSPDNLGTIVSCGSIASGATTVSSTSSVDIALATSNDSGASGTARLAVNGNKTDVTIALNGVAGTNVAAIYPGTCDNLDLTPAYELSDLDENGGSTTTIDTSLTDLLNGEYSLLVSDPDIAVGEGSAIACGEIVGSLGGTTSAPATGAGVMAVSDVSGSLVALLAAASMLLVGGGLALRKSATR